MVGRYRTLSRNLTKAKAQVTAWEDHVGQALRLQEAVRCLGSSKGTRERLDGACRHLVGMLLHQSIMPPQQRERLNFIFDTRASVSLAGGEYYAFSNLKAKDRKGLCHENGGAV